MRTSTGIGRGAPTGWIVEVCRKRRSLACSAEIHLADLVEEERAAVGDRRGARLVGERAGEGALQWPKSSDSSRSRGIAAQLSGTKGFAARVDMAWIARAQTSLPVPLSPVMNTVAVERPIERTIR